MAAAFLLTTAAGAFDPAIDSPMYRLPDLPGPPVEIVFPEGLRELWLRALQRPEAELRLKAADAIALAHQRGMKGLDAAVAPLLEALDAPDQDEAVRLAIARTLIALNARQAAANLMRWLEPGSAGYRETVEPILAHWEHRPARALWLARLRQPTTPPRSLVLAIQALGVVHEPEAVELLRRLATAEDSAGPTRVEAGRALGAICDTGLEPDAESLSRGAVSHRLAAAQMLRRHRSARAVALLERLARDREAAVAVVAADALIEHERALPLVDHLQGSSDPELRLRGVEVLFRAPANERIRRLSDRLADPHSDVRNRARQHLHALAAMNDLHSDILGEATRLLAGRDWRGLEQAAILLTQLEHRPAAPRLAELLTADRPEVFITAAWGLRRLAVPKTLKAVHDYVHGEFGRQTGAAPLAGRNAVTGEMIDHQLSQLNQLLGTLKYQPADKVLRQFIAKRAGYPESRAAAIWALGLLHADKATADLVPALEDRLNERVGIPPENPEVWRMAAVALGRMKASQALPTLRRYWPGKRTQEPVANACGWAIERITGEAVPAPESIRQQYPDWFLVPQARP
jgi:HEAT repeat protein